MRTLEILKPIVEVQNTKLNAAQKAANALEKTVIGMERQLDTMYQAYRKNPTQEGYEQYRLIFEKYQKTYGNYSAMQGTYNKLAGEFEPITKAYQSAVEKYNQEQTRWKSSIRTQDDIAADMAYTQRKLEDLQKKHFGLQLEYSAIKTGIDGLRALGLAGQAEQKMAEYEGQMAALGAQIQQLQKKKDLIKEEMDYAKHYSYADLIKRGRLWAFIERPKSSGERG